MMVFYKLIGFAFFFNSKAFKKKTSELKYVTFF